MRRKGKERHNLKHGIWQEKLAIGSIVLLYDTKRKKDMSQKLFFKWLEPYQICNAIKDKATYILKKLDGLQLVSIFVANKLKKFYSRQ